MPDLSEQLPLNLEVRSDAQPPKHCTDLPLPPCGNSGSRHPKASDRTEPVAEQLLAALDEALVVPVAPPLHEMDWRVVESWVEEAARGILFRRDRMRLVRQAMRAVHEERRTARQIGYLREQVEQQEARRRARAAPDYWARRERGRRAQQPAHVDVETDAWRRAKALAARQGVGIGEYVGRLVVAELRAPSRRIVEAPTETTRLFVRLAVEKDQWREFVASARDAGLTVSRRLGLLVERL